MLTDHALWGTTDTQHKMMHKEQIGEETEIQKLTGNACDENYADKRQEGGTQLEEIRWSKQRYSVLLDRHQMKKKTHSL